MVYTILVRVIQSEPWNWYSVVEKSVFSGGYWNEHDGEQVLTMNKSGTSGMMRFRNGNGDCFAVELGVHNEKRWCDIVTGLDENATCLGRHPSYYSEGQGNRNEVLWNQLAHLDRTTSRRQHIIVDYYQEGGNTLYASIAIASGIFLLLK